MSCMVKNDSALIDVGKLRGTETNWESFAGVRGNGKVHRNAPTAPDVFHTRLKDGIDSGTIKFTNKGDVDLVAKIYARAFDEAFAQVKHLWYQDLQWGDEAVLSLTAALSCAHDRGLLKNLQYLFLDYNNIGDKGASALADVLAQGSATELAQLSLKKNPIGEGGRGILERVVNGRSPPIELTMEPLTNKKTGQPQIGANATPFDMLDKLESDLTADSPFNPLEGLPPPGPTRNDVDKLVSDLNTDRPFNPLDVLPPPGPTRIDSEARQKPFNPLDVLPAP